MSILRLTSTAIVAAASLGIAGAASAGPAVNLSDDQQITHRADASAVTPVYHRHHYGYYYSPYYYSPRYHYAPRYYGYYPGYYAPYYGPSLGIGIQIR